MATLLQCLFFRCAWLPFAAVLAISLSACGAGDGQGLDENGNLLINAGSASTGGGGDGGGAAPGASGNPNATLAWVQSNVFGGVCSICHSGASAPMGVDWSSESATCSNINRASGEMPSLMEIDSGNPGNSYVVWKIENAGPNGEPIVGVQMPMSNPPLSADAIQNIRDWIGDGTPECTAPRPAGKTTLSSAEEHQSVAVDNILGAPYPEGSWLHVWESSLRLCSTCHSSTPSNPSCLGDLECPPAGLVLTPDNYYGLFGSSTVVPFAPDGSVLWRRIVGDGEQQRMPLGYPPLSEDQQLIIRNWIEDGAPLWPPPLP